MLQKALTINPKVTAGTAGTSFAGACVIVALFFAHASPPDYVVAAITTVVSVPCGFILAWLTALESKQ